MEDHFLSIAHAAAMIDVSVWTIRKWVRERKIRAYRFGRAVRIKESDLLKFAEVTPSVDDLKEDLDIDE